MGRQISDAIKASKVNGKITQLTNGIEIAFVNGLISMTSPQ